MLFRQLFDRESSTYTNLIARRRGGEALLLDPVREDVDKYLRSADEYVALMNSLKLPNPKLMDVAVPANLACGRAVA